MSVTIYRYGTIVARATVDPDQNSQQAVSLMDADTLSLSFTVPQPINFAIGDYCYFSDKLYQINVLPKRAKTAARNFSYELVMEAEWYDLGRVQFLFLDSNNQFTESVFSFRGTPRDYGDLIVKNMLRVFPTAGWKLGSVIEGDFITTDFSAQNCLEALKTVATAFQTEYLIDGKTINIYQRQTASGIVLKYGKDEALISLTNENQDNSNVITRLYAYGSTRNITNSYRSGATHLRLPGQDNFIEKNIDKYNVFESTVIFDGTTTDPKNNAALPEIYPHRTGTISAVDDFLNFYDSSIDFDVNGYLISGVTAQIVFNTGLLAGYTFDIHAFDNTAKKFTINQNTVDKSLIVPTASLTPMVGDQYVIVNITLPQSYIDTAETALLAAARDYLNSHSVPPVKYTVECNSFYFKSNNVQLGIGQSIGLYDADLGIDVTTRVIGFTRNVRKPELWTLTLADTVKPTNLLVKVINGL